MTDWSTPTGYFGVNGSRCYNRVTTELVVATVTSVTRAAPSTTHSCVLTELVVDRFTRYTPPGDSQRRNEPYAKKGTETKNTNARLNFFVEISV